MLDAIPRALAGRRMLTREELALEVGRLAGSDEAGGGFQRGAPTLAALWGELCFAPSVGQKVRFAHPREWLKGWEQAEKEPSIGEVIRRYLAAYGPATREEFVRWFGMGSPARAGRLIEDLGEEIARVEIEGVNA